MQDHTNTEMQSRSDAESLARDLFMVLTSARTQHDLDPDEGFSNQPLAGKACTITYLYFPKREIMRVPEIPSSFKQRLGAFNILATVDKGARRMGLFLLCALDMPFSKVDSENQVVEGLQHADVTKYADMVRELLTADLQAHMPTTGNDATH